MATQTDNRNQAEYDPRNYRLKLFPVIMAIAVFCVSAVLFNANGIKRDIELMKYGRVRDVALSVFNPIAGFSNRLGLTSFRTMIENKIGYRLHNEKINP